MGLAVHAGEARRGPGGGVVLWVQEENSGVEAKSEYQKTSALYLSAVF